MYLEINHPELCEDDVLRPKDTLCVRIPVKAPEGSILRTESPLNTLERVKKFATEWILPGHINGDNTHNVSATISIDTFDWIKVGKWMWDNKNVYNGLSVLPYFGGSYKQAPFENITKEQYEEKIISLQSVDLTKVTELDDTVDFGQVAACAGGACEVA
jgi:ribonucleoside-diphosphate reductase alpha chain